MNSIKKISLGKNCKSEIYWDLEHSVNKHVAFIGTSGGGKSVAAQKFITQIVESGGTVFLIDYHGVLSDDQIFTPFKDIFSRYTNNIDPIKDGIPLNLFEPLEYPDGYVESPEDTAGAVAEILSQALTSGNNNCNQRALLTKACSLIIREKMSDRGFVFLYNLLAKSKDKTAQKLAERIYFLASREIFTGSGELIKKGCINIVHLSKMSLDSQRMITEILLSYLWRVGNADLFKNNNLFLFIDEMQNLSSKSNGALASLISEGRKMGINLLLATQILPSSNANTVMQRLPQCGLILFFKPSANKVLSTAKMIDPNNDSAWKSVLQNLHPGEFIATGDLLIGNQTVTYPIRVDARYEQPKTTPKSIAISNKSLANLALHAGKVKKKSLEE